MESERSLWAASLVLLAIAFLCGAYIALYRGPTVLAIGAVGVLVALLYTAGSRNIKSLGLGELAVFLVYGPLMTVAAYFVQTGLFSWASLAASLPVGIVMALILLSNNIRDIKADAGARVRTLAVRIGAGQAKTLFYILTAIAYALAAIFSILGAMPITSLIVLASVPYAFYMARKAVAAKAIPNNSAELVSRFALIFGILFAVGIVL
jgi:1,4-dihydroxy-2-naphthoate octaprenyltransferase